MSEELDARAVLDAITGAVVAALREASADVALVVSGRGWALVPRLEAAVQTGRCALERRLPPGELWCVVIGHDDTVVIPLVVRGA